MSDPDKCEQVVFYSENKPVGNPIPPPPCGEEPKKIPQELVEPAGELETYTPDPLPRPMTLYSLPVTARCEIDVIDTTSSPGEAIPSEGAPVFLAEGERTSVISIQSIAGIDQSILTYIAKAKLEDEIEAALKSRTLTAQGLTRLTGMPPSKAALFMQLADAIHANLDSTAKAVAISALECVWWNVAQTATCEEDKDMAGVATTNEHPSAVATYTVPERTVSSDVGRGVADSIAKAQAVAALECFWISDPVEVDCTTRPDRPEEFTEWVVTDPEGVVPRRVGYYALPAGHVVSYVSKEDADAVALQIALAELNCFYINRHIDKQCDDLDARSLNIDPELPGNEKPVGVYLGHTDATLESEWNWIKNPDVRTPAQRVIVPERYIISTISTTDANNQAIQLADSMLACCYINDRIFIECPEEANKDYSPTWSYEVPRGTFVSCKSKKDANDQAWASAEGIVDCIYCNDTVLPQCVPNWVIDAVTTGIMLPQDIEMNGAVYPAGSVFKLPLPLKVDGLVNPYTGELVNVADWSMDATIGVAKDTVCSTSKREVDEIVELLPAVVTEPKTGVPACRFKSTRLLAGCAFVDPYNPGDQEDTTGTSRASVSKGESSSATTLYEPAPITYYGVDADGKQYRAYKAKPTRSLSTTLSQPTPGDYIDFPEGLFVATAADVPEYRDRVNDLTLDEAEQIVKRYLDSLVLELAKSVIECRYANPRTVVDCTYSRRTPSYSGRRRSGDIVGDGYAGFNDPVARAANGWRFGWSKPSLNLAPGSTNPTTRDGELTVIEAGTIQDGVYQNVLKQTRALAESLLYCKYVNDPMSCSTDCGSTTAQGAHLVSATGDHKRVEKGTIIADSLQEANTLAAKMVICEDAVCLYGNDEMSKICTCIPPGSSVAGTDSITYTGSAVVPANMFVGENAWQVENAAKAHLATLCELDCLARIPSPILYFSKRLEVKCEEKTSSCTLGSAGQDEFVQYEGGVQLALTGMPESIVLPDGMFVSEVAAEVEPQAIETFATQLCAGVWTNTNAVSYTTKMSVVSFLYKPGQSIGDGTTSNYGTYIDYTNYDVITETHVLAAGAIVADTEEGVCDTIKAIASTGIGQASAAATQAAARWAAGYGEGGDEGCGEICSIEYKAGEKPVIKDGAIQINYASQKGGGSYAGVVKSIQASSSVEEYTINDGEIQLPYADGERSIYGVIGSVQELQDEDATASLEKGVLKIPKGGTKINGIRYDESISRPEISDGTIKLSVANSGSTGSQGQLGGMSGVSVVPELTGPTIAKGVLQLNPATSPTGMGLVANIDSNGTELKIEKGTIFIPKADQAGSRPGLISSIEAATGANWEISDGAIKVALADDGSGAGLIKSVKVDENATDPSISSGEITIPLGKYTFEAPWLQETNGTVRFVEAQADTVATDLANKAKAQVDAATITVTDSTVVMESTIDSIGRVGDIVADANITGTVGSPGGSVRYSHPLTGGQA